MLWITALIIGGLLGVCILTGIHLTTPRSPRWLEEVMGLENLQDLLVIFATGGGRTWGDLDIMYPEDVRKKMSEHIKSISVWREGFDPLQRIRDRYRELGLDFDRPERDNAGLQVGIVVDDVVEQSAPERCAVEKIIRLILAYEADHPGNASDEVASMIDKYEIMAKNFRNAGGAVNFCLADALNRLQLARLGQYLVNNPDDVNSAEGMLNRIAVSLSIDRTNKVLNPSEWQGSGTVTSPYGIIPFDLFLTGEDKEIDYAMAAVVVEGLPERLSDMFKIDAKRVLMWRVELTDRLKFVLLPGLIAYLRAGGTMDDLLSCAVERKPYVENRDFFYVGEDRDLVTLGWIREFAEEHRNGWMESKYVRYTFQ